MNNSRVRVESVWVRVILDQEKVFKIPPHNDAVLLLCPDVGKINTLK